MYTFFEKYPINLAHKPIIREPLWNGAGQKLPSLIEKAAGNC